MTCSWKSNYGNKNLNWLAYNRLLSQRVHYSANGVFHINLLAAARRYGVYYKHHSEQILSDPLPDNACVQGSIRLTQPARIAHSQRIFVLTGGGFAENSIGY
jgi:hypothetical protein